jgi:hypothetical protein
MSFILNTVFVSAGFGNARFCFVVLGFELRARWVLESLLHPFLLLSLFWR